MSQVTNTLAELPLEQLKSLARRLGSKPANVVSSRIPPRSPAGDCAPLSYAQQRLWLIDQIELDTGGAYNIASCARFEGHVSHSAVEASISEIIRRHEVLRTTFHIENGSPVQRILPVSVLTLTIVDLTGTRGSVSEREAKQLAAGIACRSLRLGIGPLILGALLRLSTNEDLLVVCVHHTVFDGWSSYVFSREFDSIYAAFRQGEQCPLPELAIQYADFAVWQRKWLQGNRLQTLLSYWKKQLADPTVLELPSDFPRPAVYSYRGSRQAMALSGALSSGIEELSNRLGITRFMTMLTAFSILLSRKSGQKDLLIGAPIANRMSVELEDLIGCFVNTLVFRIDASGDPTFDRLSRRVSEMCRQAYAHQDLPFEKLVEEVNPSREMSRNPLFQAVFNYNNTPMRFKMNDDSNRKLEGGMLNGGTAVFELTLTVDPVNRVTTDRGEMNCILEYNKDLFESVTIGRMLDQLVVLLDAAVNNSALSLSELPVLSHQEQHQLLTEWNDTDADTSEQIQVHRQFEREARQRPDAIALQFEEAQLTYYELNRRANQLSQYLYAKGVAREDLVGIYLPRSLEWVVGILAAVKAGAAYVPLDPDGPPERLQHMMERTRVVVTDNLGQPKLMNSRTEIINVDRDREEICRQSTHDPQLEINHAGLVYVIYTSGSTGSPKGVAIEHRGLMNLVAWHRREYATDHQDRATQVAQASFDASVWEMWPYLAGGARLEIASQETRMDPDKLVQWIQASEITISFLPTPMAESVLEQKWHCAPQLRQILTGGDRLRQGTRDGQTFKLINHYGPTENTVVATSGVVDVKGQAAPSIGRSIMNTQVYVLDKNWRPVDIGVPGELAIAGNNLARGYLAQPALTAEKFIPNPFGGSGERLYLTGDLVKYMNDGRIDFIGRQDTQVKLRGYRIELGEIEAALNSHPEIERSLVVAQEGEGREKRLVAYIIEKGRSPQTPEEFRNYLKDKLPEYMTPAAFVKLERFPLTRHGKVDVKALPAADAARIHADEEYISPRTEIERAIAAIWQEILGAANIGVHDNFFDRGGNSLLIVRMANKLREKLGIHVSVVDIFKHPTVSSLAALATSEENEKPFFSSILERAEMRKQAMDF